MAQPKPFRADKTAAVILNSTQRDFILPICLPDPELQVGEGVAVLVVTTVEGQRVGVPIGVNALEHLQGSVEAVTQVLKAGG